MTVGNDHLGLLTKKKSPKRVSDFELLWSYDHLEHGVEGKDY